jgi:hypothetical protein
VFGLILYCPIVKFSSPCQFHRTTNALNRVRKFAYFTFVSIGV